MLARDLLREHAEMMEQLRATNHLSGGQSFHSWLLAHGEECGPRIRLKGQRMMRPKECHSNSMKALLHRPELGGEWFYTEGIVCSPDLPLLIDHAWLTNRAGEVLDLTLRRKGVDGKERETPSYFGIPMATDYALQEALRAGVYGLFSNGVMFNRNVVWTDISAGRAWPRKKEEAE
jgi:hypothetical protein